MCIVFLLDKNRQLLFCTVLFPKTSKQPVNCLFIFCSILFSNSDFYIYDVTKESALGTSRQKSCDALPKNMAVSTQCESTPLLGFLTFFHKRFRFFNQFFTHLLYVPIYARLQFFIQLSPTLTKLCHIKRDYLVHIIYSKRPPSAETHVFRRLRKSLIVVDRCL